MMLRTIPRLASNSDKDLARDGITKPLAGSTALQKLGVLRPSRARRAGALQALRALTRQDRVELVDT